MGFIDKRLLDCVSYGSSFAKEFKTQIVTMANGAESRNAMWSYPKGRYNIDYNAVTAEQYEALNNAFVICRGMLRAFRFKDWSDFEIKDQLLAVGTGEIQSIQLFKRYNFGGEELLRPIYKPILETVKLTVDGDPIAYTISANGRIDFVATQKKEVIIDCEFDIPVRFESDKFTVVPLKNNGDGTFIMSTGADLVEVLL